MDLKNKILWFALFLFAIAAVFFALNTNTMLRLLISKASDNITGTLDVKGIQGRLLGPIKLQKLHFNSENIEIRISVIDIDWNPVSFIFDNLHIKSLAINGVDITISGNKTEDRSVSSLLNQINLAAILPIEIDSGIIRNIRIHQKSINKTELINEIKISGKKRNAKLSIDTISIEAPDYIVDATAVISSKPVLSIFGNVHWDWHKQGTKRNSGAVTLQGDVNLLRIVATLEKPEKLNFNGELKNLDSNLTWQGNLIVRDFDYARYYDDININHELTGLLNGEGNLQGDLNSVALIGSFNTSLPEFKKIKSFLDLKYTAQTLNINKANFTQVNTSANLQLQGKLILEKNTWKFKGHSEWQDIKLPLTTELALLSPNGEATGIITNKNYNVRLQKSSVLYGNTLLNNIEATVTGNYLGLDINKFNASISNGSLTGETSLSWKKGLSWKSEITANHINPADLRITQLANWAGDISTVVKSSGHMSDDNFETQVKLSETKGVLRDKPLTANGELTIFNNNYSTKGFQVVHGDTSIKLNGDVGKNWNINWDIIKADIAMLNTDISGKFSSKGSVTGVRHGPVIKANINASEIDFNQQQKIEKITANFDIDLGNKTNSSFMALANNIQYQDYLLDEIELTATGKQDNHQINTVATSGIDIFTLTMNGAIDKTKNLQWQGKITSGSLYSELADDWQLLPVDGITLSQYKLELPETCWINNKARWCINSQWHKGQNLDAGFTFVDVPMSFFQVMLKEQFRLEGLLNGRAELHALDEKIQNATIELDVSNGSIDMVLDEEVTRLSSFKTGEFSYKQQIDKIESKLSFQIEENENVIAELKLTSPNNSFTPISEWLVVGRLQAKTQHPDFIRLFYTAIKNIQGEWQSDIQMSGTLDNPIFSGYSNVSNSIVTIPAIGVELKKVNLDIKSSARNKFKIMGGFHSGEGLVTISGQLSADPSWGWPVELDVTGENVQIFNVNGSVIEISPKLKFKKVEGIVAVNGNIDISRAIIKTKSSIPVSIKISDDVVFINAKESSGENVRRKQSRWDIYSDIKYTLSDRVYFEGYGISGGLTGSVDVKAEPGKVTTGQGALHIKQGRYKFFSTVLDLDIGRLIFENDFIENPAINARASKSSGDITAGVRITGHLKSPDVSVYSIPTMPESEAVSYLLFGKRMDDNSFGLDSLKNPAGSSDSDTSTGSSGSYIDYAVGLLSSTSVLRIRFELTKNWELYTESSVNHQGAEIIYTFER